MKHSVEWVGGIVSIDEAKVEKDWDMEGFKKQLFPKAVQAYKYVAIINGEEANCTAYSEHGDKVYTAKVYVGEELEEHVVGVAKAHTAFRAEFIVAELMENISEYEFSDKDGSRLKVRHHIDMDDANAWVCLAQGFAEENIVMCNVDDKEFDLHVL